MNRIHMPLAPFDPMAGDLVLAPERNEDGYWVGCPGVLHDGEHVWLTYRQRRPRGAEMERGWRCAVAKSRDGLHFEDLWDVRKDALNTPSMERFCLLPKPGGGYRLYISYVDPADNRWRIDAAEAAEPDRFDIGTATAVLTAASTGTEGVKDPYVVQTGPVFHLFASYAAARCDLSPEAHASADIYNVGATTHPTGYATSLDGLDFCWHGTALEVGTGWDRYQARLNSIVPIGGGYIGFYDGSAGSHENYEERCGIAISGDPFSWRSLSVAKPWVVSPHGSGSVRYVDAVVVNDEWWIYYEMTRPDGAHELRLVRLPSARLS
jgi:hypothetical protein